MDFSPSKSICPCPIQTTGTLVILWTRDKRETIDFRAHSEMVYNKRVRSLGGSIQGVEGENKRGGGGGGENRCVMNL
jgi:hypothetical protein